MNEKKERKEVEVENHEASEKTQAFCAIPKEFVLKRLEQMYRENKSVFDEYNVWLAVLNARVDVTNKDQEI